MKFFSLAILSMAMLLFVSCEKDGTNDVDKGVSVEQNLKAADGGGCIWSRFMQHPMPSCPNCGWFCNERMCGTCLPEVVIIAPEGVMAPTFEGFKGAVNSNQSVGVFMEDEAFVELMQFDDLESELFNGLIDGTYKFLILENEEEGLEYVTVVDSSFDINEDDLEEGSYFTVQVSITD